MQMAESVRITICIQVIGNLLLSRPKTSPRKFGIIAGGVPKRDWSAAELSPMLIESNNRKYEVAASRPMSAKELATSPTAVRANPAENRQRFQRKNKKAIGSTIWNLNKPRLRRTPARNSRPPSSATNAAVKQNNNRIESCPCMRATAVGRNTITMTELSHGYMPSRVDVHRRISRTDSASTTRLNTSIAKYAALNDK